MAARTNRPTHTRRHFLLAAGLALLLTVGIGLWSQMGSKADESNLGSDPRVPLGQDESTTQDLVNPGKKSRQTDRDKASAADAPEDPAIELEDPNDGWGQVEGTATVNGLPLESGKLHWNDPISREQGYAPIEKGTFQFDAPVGEIQVTAWVVAHNGFTVPGHETNSFDELTKLSPLTILDGKLNPLHFTWIYDEVLMQGDALMVPSMRPLAHTGLFLSGAGPWLRIETDAAGLFFATVPHAANLGISHISGGTAIHASFQEGWTPLRIPDAHTILVNVRDGRTGELISDFDFFLRSSLGAADPALRWRRYRDWSALLGPKKLTNGVDTSHKLSLPAGKIDILVYAPRLGLAPHRQSNLEVGPQTPSIEVTLQPGGTLAFTCNDPPPTGLVNPGYDPDPIMVVEQRMFDWNEPNAQAFGGHVDREGAIPRNLLFTRRLSFNLQGEAIVKGLPTGTYRVLHWRKGVNWRSEPLEVVAGLTTNVHLVPE